MRTIHERLPFYQGNADIQNIEYREYRRSIDRTESSLDYIKAMLDRYSKLLVLRVEFYFQEKHPNFSEITSETAVQHLQNYLNNTRNNGVFKDLLGYVIRLEYGHDGRGWHFHCLFLLNGHAVQSGYYHAKMYGEYWVKMLSRNYPDSMDKDLQPIKMGHYNSCNQAIYQRDGIGLVSFLDDEKIYNLLHHVVPYLSKPDSVYVEQNAPRAFWRGLKPKPREVPLGRPRQYESFAKLI